MLILSLLAAVIAKLPSISIQLTSRGDLVENLTAPFTKRHTLNEFSKLTLRSDQPKDTKLVAYFLKPRWTGAPDSTRPVLGKYEESERKFVCVLDLGDPVAIQPIEGEYDLVFISGKQGEAQEQVLGSFNVKFTKPLLEFKNEFSVAHREQIIFQGSTPRPSPNFLFVVAHAAAILIAGALFLIGLLRTGINCSRFPNGAGAILNLLFLGLLGAVFGVLCLFWIRLTLIQTLQYLGLLALPTVVVGNYAMLSRK